MTTELILLLGIYAFLVMGVFLGDSGPIETFKKTSPRLAARIERNVAVGYKWRKSGEENRSPKWLDQ